MLVSAFTVVTTVQEYLAGVAVIVHVCPDGVPTEYEPFVVVFILTGKT